MDLIYTDGTKDLGVLQDYTLDLAYGSDENDFFCTVGLGNHCCSAGSLLYIPNTEYGGIVDTVSVDTNEDTVGYYGRTWHGILAGKVICPDTGEDYLILSGDANAVIGQLITRCGLGSLFQASGEISGLTVNNYQVPRYIDAWQTIRRVLSSVGAKPSLAFNGSKVILGAAVRKDYSQDEEWDSSQISFQVALNSRPVNHVICLGQGDLAQRQVIHLYADASGNISGTQSLTGLQEVTAVYDYSSAESEEELEQGGRELLEASYAAAKTITMSFDAGQEYDLGDIVGARENVTGLFVTAEITKKIVTINKDGLSIEYKAGE